MKKFCLIIVIAGISFLLFGGHVSALPNPDPTAFGDDDGTEIFTPSEQILSIEIYDLFDPVPDAISIFGFFFEGADVTDPNNLIPIFEDEDQFGGVYQQAIIDFSKGEVYDADDPLNPVLQNTFTGTGNIGFFLALDPPEIDPLLLYTVSSLHPGGIDLAATFPSLSDPSAYLIGFEAPDPNSNTGFTTVAFEVVVGVTPVPEPGTLLLLGAGLAGFVVVYRKMFKK